jgi:hypothetical protein
MVIGKTILIEGLRSIHDLTVSRKSSRAGAITIFFSSYQLARILANPLT